jgi:hypothetical protein
MAENKPLINEIPAMVSSLANLSRELSTNEIKRSGALQPPSDNIFLNKLRLKIATA